MTLIGREDARREQDIGEYHVLKCSGRVWHNLVLASKQVTEMTSQTKLQFIFEMHMPQRWQANKLGIFVKKYTEGFQMH